jgi:starch-binding outer membrane protein SusE/F
MKKIKILLVMIVALIGFNSCEKDELVFTAQAPGEFAFTNDFLSEYTLTTATSANVGERFTWESQNFEAPTAVTYELQGSIIGDFTDMTVIGSTSGNDIAVTVGKLLSMAATAGLDNDPNSDAPNTGNVYFRLRAYSGNNAIETLSSIQTLTLVLPEIVDNGGGSGISIASWGVVGSGYNDWGSAGPDAKFYTTAEAGVIVSYVNLVDGEIKFRENNTWSGDVGDANLDGVLDSDANNNIAVTAGDYKITIDTNDMSYTIEPFSWGIVGSGYNDWGNGGPDAKFYYDYTTDTFKVGVKLIDGEIKVRPLNTWSGDLGDANLDGVLDADANNNIAVTAGHYLITLDLKDNSYSIESAAVWGAVGSGYNDWGNGGPDAALTEIQPGVMYGDNITLIDGEIKFRADNTWSGDVGDANLDNILDSDANNNIAVTAGNYVITIDFNDPDGPKYSLLKR